MTGKSVASKTKVHFTHVLVWETGRGPKSKSSLNTTSGFQLELNAIAIECVCSWSAAAHFRTKFARKCRKSASHTRWLREFHGNLDGLVVVCPCVYTSILAAPAVIAHVDAQLNAPHDDNVILKMGSKAPDTVPVTNTRHSFEMWRFGRVWRDQGWRSRRSTSKPCCCCSCGSSGHRVCEADPTNAPLYSQHRQCYRGGFKKKKQLLFNCSIAQFSVERKAHVDIDISSSVSSPPPWA